jgi:hypothetical protein
MAGEYRITGINVQISREGRAQLESLFPEFGEIRGTSTGWGITPTFSYDFNPPMNVGRVVEVTKKLFELKVGYWQFNSTKANEEDPKERDSALIEGRI